MFELATPRSRGVLAIALISACTAIIMLSQAAAYAAPMEQAKATPHPAEGRENCLSCHPVGSGGVKAAPADHEGRANETCLMCHATGSAAPAQPAGTEPSETAASGPAAQAEGSATGQVQDNPVPTSDVCRTCHAEPEFDIVSADPGLRDVDKQLDPERSYAHRYIACTTCHGADPHEVMEPVTKASIADACGSCHVAQRVEHEESIHGQSLASGGKDAATCIDCHSTQDTPHSIARVLSPDSPTYRASIASTCAKCHAKEEVMERYDVPTEVYKTYIGTFHGKANVLSPYEITQHPKANCISCHGYHDIKAENDPASPVNSENLSETCGSCHPGAGEEFAAGWLGHKEASPQQFPVVYFAERFFFFLTSSVLTFGFIFMVALELGSWIIRRKPTQH